MLLGLHALEWIASQEAFPLTCFGLFKANIYVICMDWGAQGSEKIARGVAVLTWYFFFSCSCRMSATQCLKHEWLNNLPAKAKRFKLRLKSQLLLQSYIAQRKWKVISLENLLPMGKISSTQTGPAFLNVGSFLLIIINMRLGILQFVIWSSTFFFSLQV